MIIILMGVAGSGKTTIGQTLARDLGWAFYDGDNFHPPANVDQMARGIALTDADRQAWLDALRALIDELAAQNTPAVIACSALKESYRRRLTHGHQVVRLVYLKGNYDLIRQRLEARQDHFMRAALLASQFATLEEPVGALTVDSAQAPAVILTTIKAALEL